MKRVVVTGLGAITPIGNTVPAYLESLRNGVSGAAPITQFDTTHFKTKFACEVKNFNPDEFIDRKEVRRIDRFTQFALVSAGEAIRDAGFDGVAAYISPEIQAGAEKRGLKLMSGFDCGDLRVAERRLEEQRAAIDDPHALASTFLDIVRGDPLSLYARLRGTARAGFGALIDTGPGPDGMTILSLSPELFFALEGTPV